MIGISGDLTASRLQMYRTWANPDGGTSEITTMCAPFSTHDLSQLTRQGRERDHLRFEADLPKHLRRHERDDVISFVIRCDAQRPHGRARRGHRNHFSSIFGALSLRVRSRRQSPASSTISRMA